MQKMRIIELLVLIFMMALCVWCLYYSIRANYYAIKNNTTMFLHFYTLPSFMGSMYLFSVFFIFSKSSKYRQQFYLFPPQQCLSE